MKSLPLGALAVAFAWPAFGGQEIPLATVGENVGLEITIYNQNLALVKDQRTLTLQEGLNEVRFTEVAAQIDPTSVHFKSLTAPQATVIREQNFQYDLVSRAKLLEKYLDQEIEVQQPRKDGGGEILRGQLLSATDGLVIQQADGTLTALASADQVRLPKLPAGLITRPTLMWLVESGQAGRQLTEVSYLTGGINWNADYVAVVNPDDTQADLTGWVTIDNKSGATYPSARLKLIAGEVHRVQPPVPLLKMERGEEMATLAAEPQFEEKAFFEYHLYTLQRKTTLRDNETKQIELLTAANVPVKKVYVFDGANLRPGPPNQPPQAKVNVMVEVENRQENHLGMPLPKGKVRVYKADEDGSLQFVGEDEIDHTPKDEKIRLYLGDAFDLVGERKQTDERVIADNVRQYSFEIALRNHKQEAVEITVVEHLFGDWEILRESHEHTQKDARTLEFHVRVAPDQEVKVTYTAQVKF